MSFSRVFIRQLCVVALHLVYPARIHYNHDENIKAQLCDFKTSYIRWIHVRFLGLFHYKSNSLRRIIFVNYHCCEAFLKYYGSRNAADCYLVIYQNCEHPFSFILRRKDLIDSTGCVFLFFTTAFSFMLPY